MIVPGDLVLVLFEILLRTCRPTQSHFHGGAQAAGVSRIFGALIESHDDVGAEANLNRHGTFRGKEMRRPVKMGTEGHALFCDFAEFAEAENLESPGIGENWPLPGHETVQAAKVSNLLDTRPQVEVISVAEENLDAQLLEDVLRDRLDGGGSPHRHEHRGEDLAMGGGETAQAGIAGRCLDCKVRGHLWNSNGKRASASLGSGLVDGQGNDLAAQLAFVNDQAADGDGQFESPGAGTARIEEEDLLLELDLGDVTVAKDDGGESCRLRLQVKFGEYMEHVNGNAGDLEHVSDGQRTGPSAAIDIAAHRGYGSNFAQASQDLGVANVSSMNDEIGIAQAVEGFGPKQAMSVRDDADLQTVLSSQFSVKVKHKVSRLRLTSLRLSGYARDDRAGVLLLSPLLLH